MAAKEPKAETTPQAEPAPKRQGVGGNYFIMNPSGKMSVVDQRRSVALVKRDGLRLATEEEIAEHLATKHQRTEGVYYIVNPAGAIHGVDRAHARERLRIAGWRLATEEEVRLYLSSREQRHDRPLCQPWSPDPDAQLAELD